MNDHRNGSGPVRSEITEIVISSLQEVLATAPMEGDMISTVTTGEDVYLIGREAVLDSMGLVNLIVEIEQRLEEEHDVVVILADERAMSQKRSPFRSVQSLTDYIFQLVVEEQG